ncbi:MAG TPA: sulfite oxidase-like oxidoreductase [Actinomycetota bacterium]|nr:sulfite oxidase-like oxidoreductase [Actinomycetota bacterium]
MADFISRGFTGRRRPPEELARRLPPGQYYEKGFPVLSAGPTPKVKLEEWRFVVDGLVASPREWTWEDVGRLPFEDVPCDIHRVTKWSKLDTRFGGVSLDHFWEAVKPLAAFAMARSYGGYTTNLPMDDLTGGKAWLVWEHEGDPLPPDHGGPVRLLVPHLYLWKSAKWIAGIRVQKEDYPGFWEGGGYHNRGDPWREQRYWND